MSVLKITPQDQFVKFGFKTGDAMKIVFALNNNNSPSPSPSLSTKETKTEEKKEEREKDRFGDGLQKLNSKLKKFYPNDYKPKIDLKTCLEDLCGKIPVNKAISKTESINSLSGNLNKEEKSLYLFIHNKCIL